MIQKYTRAGFVLDLTIRSSDIQDIRNFDGL